MPYPVEIYVWDKHEPLGFAAYGIFPRDAPDFEGTMGPYFHPDRGQPQLAYLWWLESDEPRAFFALVSEIRKLGLPVRADFANPLAEKIAERRYACR
jgi:hypothetical protein